MRYTVEIKILIGDDELETYLSIEAENKNEAYIKAKNMVNDTLDIRIEKNPIESLLQDDY